MPPADIFILSLFRMRSSELCLPSRRHRYLVLWGPMELGKEVDDGVEY